MEIIRNLTRRKLRNFLTISGIVIGVLALVTMGALAEKFNALLAGGANYFGSNVQVSDSSSGALPSASPDGPWQETAERFVDPTTGRLMKVRYNPQTGARDYVPVSPESDPPRKG